MSPPAPLLFKTKKSNTIIESPPRNKKKFAKIKKMKKKIFGFDLKNWQPFWQKDAKFLTDEMEKLGLNVAEFADFYRKNGDAQIAFLEKIILEKIKENNFAEMTEIQKAFLGYYAMAEFMKQIEVELNAKKKRSEDIL